MRKSTENQVSHTAIRQEVDRILQSSMFAQSDRLSRFLRYTVEHVITGQTDSLKEYVIGTEVYDRKPPYHPNQDSIVRTEARRLRSKLKEYYETEGKEDPIYIFFRLGSYVPVFRMKDSDTSYQVVVDSSHDDLFVEGAGVQIAVIPFLDLSGKPISARYASGVTDELVHALMQCEGCRVVSASSTANLGSLASDVPNLALKLGVQIVFEGTVREEGNRIRVTGRIVSADGFQLWSQRLDAEANAAEEFEMQEQFASALVSRVRPQISVVLSAKASVSPLLLSMYPNLLKAESLVEEGVVTDVQAALTRFRDIARITPGYARPACGMARCYAWLAVHGGPETYEHTSQARAAAETAMKLDPHMTDVLTLTGCVQTLEWRWEEAEASLQQAAGQRSHAPAHRQLAMLLTLLGRFDEACHHLDRAQRIDPFSYLQKAARARFFYLSRRYEEAVEHFTEPLRHGPIPLEAQLYLAHIHARLGRRDMARSLARHVQRCSGADGPSMSLIAEVYACCLDRDMADSLISRHSLLAEDAELSKYRQARLAAVLDKPGLAIDLLAASYSDKEAEFPTLVVEPAFDSIRQMPAFTYLLKEIRFPQPAPEHSFHTVS